MPSVSRGRLLVLGSLLLGGLGLAWADFRYARRAVEREVSALLAANRELRTCVFEGAEPGEGLEEGALRRRFSLSSPGASPVSPCAPVLLRADQALATLASGRHRRAGPLAARVRASFQTLLNFPADAPALELHRRAPELATLLQLAHRGTCEVARGEGVAASCDLTPLALALRAPRVLLDEAAGGDVAWSSSAGIQEISVRVAAGGRAWELRSPDGASFSTTLLPGAFSGAEPPPVIVAEGTPRVLLRYQEGSLGFRGQLIELGPGAPREIGAAPSLPPGFRVAPQGVPVVRGPSGWVTVGRDGEGKGVLMYGDSTKSRARCPGW